MSQTQKTCVMSRYDAYRETTMVPMSFDAWLDSQTAKDPTFAHLADRAIQEEREPERWDTAGMY